MMRLKEETYDVRTYRVSPLTFKETKSEWRSQILIAGARNPKEDGPVGKSPEKNKN